MAFTLADFAHLFRHVPTAEHQLSERHDEVTRLTEGFVASVLNLLPQVQEAREFAAVVDQAAKLAHAAIDKTPKVSSAESGGAESAAPAAPAVSGEATASQAVEQPEVATPPAPPAAPAATEQQVSQPQVHEATALPDPIHDLGTATPTT